VQAHTTNYFKKFESKFYLNLSDGERITHQKRGLFSRLNPFHRRSKNTYNLNHPYTYLPRLRKEGLKDPKAIISPIPLTHIFLLQNPKNKKIIAYCIASMVV